MTDNTSDQYPSADVEVSATSQAVESAHAAFRETTMEFFVRARQLRESLSRQDARLLRDEMAVCDQNFRAYIELATDYDARIDTMMRQLAECLYNDIEERVEWLSMLAGGSELADATPNMSVADLMENFREFFEAYDYETDGVFDPAAYAAEFKQALVRHVELLYRLYLEDHCGQYISEVTDRYGWA